MALCAAITLAVASPAWAGESGGTGGPTASPVDITYAQSAVNGGFKAGKGGRVKLTLRGASRQTQAYESEPVRQAWTIPTRGFHQTWDQQGFKANPPSATLSLNGNRGFKLAGLDFVRSKRRGRRLTYTASAYLGQAFTKANGGLPRHFKAATLFIQQDTAPVAGECTFIPWGECPGVVINFRDFSRQFMRGINLRGATGNGTIFTSADMPQANFRGAQLFSAIFNGTELHDADFRGASVDDATFLNGRTSFTDFRAASLTRTKFLKADLRGTKFAEADLTDADFTGATSGHYPMPKFTAAARLCHTTLPDGKVNNRDCPDS